MKYLTGLLSLLLLSGCGQSPAPTATASGAQPVATVQAPTQAVVPAASTSAVPAAIDAPTEAVTETVTETVAAETTTGPALALRIAEVKPEPASAWKEGQHYTRLVPTQSTNAPPGQVEVMEFFWYACPHCNALDPYLEAWRKTKPAYVSFVRVPIMWGQLHGLHARIYYTAEALNKLDALHTHIFAEFHTNQNPLNTAAAVQTFFTQHGVAAADFQKAFTSQAVDASLKRAQELGLQFKVESVPLIVINGKYVTDVGRAGGQQQLISLINDLAARERGT